MYGFNKPYVKNHYRKFTPIYIPGENYSFYINSDKPIDYQIAFLPLELWIVNPNTGAQIAGVCQLMRLFIAGTTGYHLYSPDFVFPRTVPDGEYQFQVYDPAYSLELCRSNLILVDSSAQCVLSTTPVKFRHNDQLYGVRYDLLSDFFQKFRIPFNQVRAPEFRSSREQYRQSSNGRELRNSKSFRDIVLTLEMYWAGDEDFGGVSAMLEHDEVYISGNRLICMTQIKTEKPTEFSNLQKGTFEAIVNDYDIDYNSLEHYGDFICFGGNSNSIYNTFVTG